MLWGCIYLLTFEMNRVRLIVSANSHAQYLMNVRCHVMTKWIILSIHCIKTVLLCIINYFQAQPLNNYELSVYSKIELWCKIIVELYMYPLFLYCYVYFVSRHKK